MNELDINNPQLPDFIVPGADEKKQDEPAKIKVIGVGGGGGTWAVFSLLPYLIISGIFTGTLNGLILQRLWKSPLRKYSIKR